MAIETTTTSLDTDTPERSRILADSQHGVLGSWWQLAIGMGEASYHFGFGVAQDTRAEARRRADATLTFAEEMGVGSFRFLRKLVDRVDRVAAEVLGRSEATALVVTRTLRKTGHGVTELASSTLSDTIGSPQTARRSDATTRPGTVATA
jgi:hypothetical protein